VAAVITTDMIKALREKTGAGVLDCRTALNASGGDLEKAVNELRKKGLAAAEKKIGRAASDGRVESYIHMGGKLGVLIEVNCETDFVAKTQDFQDLARELAMQVAAAFPRYVSREQVPAEVLENERAIYRAQVEKEGKPPQIADKIVEGKLEKYYKEFCLLEQPYIRNDKITVTDLIKEVMGKLGENIIVKRFARFTLGEGE